MAITDQLCNIHTNPYNFDFCLAIEKSFTSYSEVKTSIGQLGVLALNIPTICIFEAQSPANAILVWCYNLV